MQSKKRKERKQEKKSEKFGERLRMVMDIKKIDQSDLVTALNIGYSQMSLWVNGRRKAGPKNTRRLSEYLECDFNWLFDGSGPAPEQSLTDIGYKERSSKLAKLVRIPVLGKVPAGIPELTEEHVNNYVSLPNAPKNCYALKVIGHSMEPEIRQDDYVLFVIDREAKPGDVVVVNDEFGDSMIKRLKEKDGEYYLVSDNPAYPTYRPDENYRIMGVIIGGWRPLKI